MFMVVMMARATRQHQHDDHGNEYTKKKYDDYSYNNDSNDNFDDVDNLNNHLSSERE